MNILNADMRRMDIRVGETALPFSFLSPFSLFYLKVGSCPNDDNSVQILFCPFLCSI